MPRRVLTDPGQLAERSRYPRQHDARVTLQRKPGENVEQRRHAGADEQIPGALLRVILAVILPCPDNDGGTRLFRQMLRIGLCLGGPCLLDIGLRAAHGRVGPECAAGHDRKLRLRKLAAQTLADMLHDRRRVTGDVAELVDAVEKYHDAIPAEFPQDAEQGDIGGRQRLLRGQHHDMEMSALEGAPGDFVADQIWIVRPRRIDDGGREAEIASAEIEIRRLDDIGETPFCSAAVSGRLAQMYFSITSADSAENTCLLPSRASSAGPSRDSERRRMTSTCLCSSSTLKPAPGSA